MQLWRPPRHPALAGLVDSLEYVEDEPGAAYERMIPGGDVSIVVTLTDDGFCYEDRGLRWVDGACVAGPQRRAQVISTRPQRGMVAVNFAPGGAAPFLTTPIHALTGTYPPLDELWPSEGRTVRERLLEVGPHRTLDVMERLLLPQAVRPPRRDRALELALRALDGGRPVAAVVERYGTTAKPFIRRFRAATGLTPKAYARLRRLQHLLRDVPFEGPVDWATLAVEHGYYDQSHLIHDFTDIVGITPSHYRPRAADARNHVPAELHVSPSGPSLPPASSSA